MKDYKKYYLIPAAPEEVYKAITNPDEIQLWSGDKALMSTEPDSEFELFDGSIAGKNLAFEPGQKIEQEWYFGDQTEASLVTIKLNSGIPISPTKLFTISLKAGMKLILAASSPILKQIKQRLRLAFPILSTQNLAS